ncbi:MAG: hypothetical protein IJT36_05690 [Alphaproteobacteria bacterium]|nr:hypothetical protein [Alphaproteobacteria bacterium]
MSNIIYLKDILLAKAPKKKGRPKLKPFNQGATIKSLLKSSLVERKINKDEQQRG